MSRSFQRTVISPAERPKGRFGTFLRVGLFASVLTWMLTLQSPVDGGGFEFQADDTVAIFGNGLADRMQHSPWVETAFQKLLEGKNLRFRNMSFSGDMVNQRPRSKGFTNDDEYLALVNPEVVFAFYGYNESFAGEEGAAGFSAELIAMVDRYQAIQAKQGKELRVVLFSPIAYEQTGDPNLPEGTELNAQLSRYTAATRVAAEEAGVHFVDLFSPTMELFVRSETRYTLNGIHLNETGYKALAGIITEALLDKPAPDLGSLNGLYETIEDKNWHWHNRYRATDGNDVWGSRSTLTFVNGQSNADVLKHELVMLDVMTSNRDPAIWAAASGKSYKVDDSNVPPPVEVISNVGGGSKSSNPDKEGSIEYLSPEESIAKIDVPEGYELNVFASEVQFPELANPVQLQVDALGRLWAASWNTYPKWEPGKEMNDKLMIFEDTDGDGTADVSKIFAHVHNPLGFEFWNGGVVVTSGPDLLFLKDTDGDDKADVRYPLLQGLGTSDTHHAANNLIYGPDGGIYWQSGVFLVHNHETPWKQNLNVGASGMYRFDPRTFAITPHAANKPNPHGTSFDYWGYLYSNDGTGGRSYQVRPEGKGFKMHKLLEKEFRPVAANAILSSDHFPEDMQQDFLICNTIGFLGVKLYNLDRGEDIPETLSTVPNNEDIKITQGGALITVNHPALAENEITRFRLSVDGRQQMNIAEVVALAEGENIAGSAKVSQSSVLSNGYKPERLIDGRINKFAHTKMEENPWMQGEFPEPVRISSFVVHNRKGHEDRFDNGKIEFFNGDKLIASVKVNLSKAVETTVVRKFGDVWGTPGVELLNSRDRNFRPADAIVGADGALYVADWHNAIIGHMQHNIRDPNRDKRHGRIIRLTRKGAPLQEAVAIAGQPIEALLENLKHPINGVRHRTRVELSQRDSAKVLAAAVKWAKDFDANDPAEAHHLLEAVWLHQQHNARNQEMLDRLLGSDVRHAVVAARVVEHFWKNVDTTGASEFAAEAEVEFVEFKVPGHLKGDDRKAYKLGAEVYQREAHCATCHLTHGKGNGLVYPSLVNSPWVNGSEDRLIKLTLHGLWGKLKVDGKVYDPSRGVPPMTAFRSLLTDDELAAALTFVRNTWGNKAKPVSADAVKRVRAATKKRNTFWKPEELTAVHPLETELMSEADRTQVVAFSNLELEAELMATPSLELAKTAMEKGNAFRGKKVFYESSAACFACHDPPTKSTRLGPNLSDLKTRLTPAQLVDSLLRPSDLIDKDYAQVSVLTAAGQIKTGVVVRETDDELVIQNVADPEPITIAGDDIEEVMESKVSLMPENLVRQLKNRREFDDLMKYIITIRNP